MHGYGIILNPYDIFLFLLWSLAVFVSLFRSIYLESFPGCSYVTESWTLTPGGREMKPFTLLFFQIAHTEMIFKH